MRSATRILRAIDDPDRYEPLPSIGELPGWIWRKTSRRFRIAAGIALVAAIAITIALIPDIRESKDRRAEAVQRERAEDRAELIRELEAEQRPRAGRSRDVAGPGATSEARLSARAGQLTDVRAAILADARRRAGAGDLDGRIRRVRCEPFPRTVDGTGAEADLGRRRGRYSCVAVTSEFEATDESPGGIIGHEYRALVDFRTGRFAYCKIAGQAGVERDQLVTTPRACGGR